MDITALIGSDDVKEGDVLLLEEGIYYQTVNIPKDNIRIVAKGDGVIFDGKSSLFTDFILLDVVGMGIEGINIRYYRDSGIIIKFGSGNRIANNRINNLISDGIEIVGSSCNLVWKNQVCNCSSGIRLAFGSTNNWIIENIVKDGFGNGLVASSSTDSNNAFISNAVVRNRGSGLTMFGSNNLLMDNLITDNGEGVVIHDGRDSLAIGNMIKSNKVSAYWIFDGYVNHFAGENCILCNGREGLNNHGEYGIMLNNEVSYNGDIGIRLETPSKGNLVKENKMTSNILENIVDRGDDNNFINNVDKPYGTCEAQEDAFGDGPEEDKWTKKEENLIKLEDIDIRFKE